MIRDHAQLRADIARGLADVADGRLADFDPERIIARGRKLLADRANSASPKRRKRRGRFARIPQRWDNRD